PPGQRADRTERPPHTASRQASQEPRKVGTQAVEPARSMLAGSATPPAEQPRFDIQVPATEKNSYMFSEDELWALRDVEAEVERAYRIDVPKYNIVRLGLHMLLEDYYNDKQQSFLVRRLGLSR